MRKQPVKENSVSLPQDISYPAYVDDLMECEEADFRTYAVSTLLQLFGASSSRQQYLDAVVELVGIWSTCRCVGIRVLDEDGNIPYESYVGFSRDFWEKENWLSVRQHQCACIRIVLQQPEPQDMRVLTTGGSFRCDDVGEFVSCLSESEKKHFRSTCVRSGFQSVAIVPIRCRDKVLGVIHIADESRNRVPMKVIDFLEMLATLIGEATQRFNVEAALQRDYATRTVISSLLHLALENIPLDALLRRALDLVLSIPWLTFVPKGRILLLEGHPETLVSRAESGLGKQTGAACSSASGGRALCAQATATRKIRFFDDVVGCDQLHGDEDSSYWHYCIPIASSDKTLGVIKVYVKKGHRRTQREEEYLGAIANTLAGIIMRKQMEEALLRSEARYRAIVQDQTELISRFTPGGTLTFVNDSYCRFFGETKEELVGRGFWQHVPEPDHSELASHIAALSFENPVRTIEHRVVTQGDTRWLRWTDRAIFDDRGRVVEFQSVGRDISESKRAERALLESERRLRFLSAQLITAQENERKRIASDLHDGIGQSLTVIKFGMENLRSRMRRDGDPPGLRSMEDLIDMVQMTIEEVRKIMADLRPSLLDDLGIVATIGWLCREYQKIYGEIHIEKRIEVNEDDIAAPLKTVVFRVLQEALNNIAKHSKADQVRLALFRNKDALELVIEDNGQGFDPQSALGKKSPDAGFGLHTMKERTELAGGLFVIQSDHGKGTIIKARWPDL